MGGAGGIAIAKEFHWATATNRVSGDQLFRRRFENEPVSLAAMIDELERLEAERGGRDRCDRVTAEFARELAHELRQLRERLSAIDRELEAALERHPDVALIRSLPRMGATLTAEFIAEAGTLTRSPTPDDLATTAGLTPILRHSAQVRYLQRARGGNKTLKLGLLPIPVLLASLPHQPRLLRPQTSRGRTTPPSRPHPRTTTHQRPARHPRDRRSFKIKLANQLDKTIRQLPARVARPVRRCGRGRPRRARSRNSGRAARA